MRDFNREEAALDSLVKARVKEALDDSRPPVALKEAFEQIRKATATPIS